jgi:acetyl esterase
VTKTDTGLPLDPRIAAALAALNAVPIDRSGTPAERRARLHELHADAPSLVAGGPALHSVEDRVVPGPGGPVPVRIYRPRPGVLPGYVYMHGGGWWLGSIDDADAGCRRRAAAADAVVVSVGYRLAPEHPFPAALDDCYAVAMWVLDEAEPLEIDPARIVLGGGSAGGNLAAAVALRARDAGDSRFAAQVLEVPGLDLTMTGESFELYGEGYLFTKADLRECAEFYLGSTDPTDPLVSPVFAAAAGLPPALVMTAECDPVRDSGERFAANLAAAGVDATLIRWDGMVHGAPEMDTVVPDVAERYRAAIISFLDRVLDREARSRDALPERRGAR